MIKAENKLETVRKILKEYDQEHLLYFYERLTPDEKGKFLDDILKINFELIINTYKQYKDERINKKADRFRPLKAKKLKSCPQDERKKFYNIGMNAIKNGKVAVCVVAGGQGTRLGHNGPKGTFNIGLPSGKSFFQLQCERLINLSKKAGNYIPFYIMTSTPNHCDTVKFFEKHRYFGYKKDMIKFFTQKDMPAINSDGKVLLSGINKIAMSPDGNGGCFKALKESGCLSEMKKKKIEWLFLYGIDNALVRVADPYFIGFTICSKQMAASKVVAKKYPQEKVGILCYKNDRPAIVEYSEIPESLANKLNEDGELVYSNANIISHLLNIDFIESAVDKALPLHMAHKKISYISEDGKLILPDKPNGYKFEYFLFDIFESLDDMAALEVGREEEFAPVKNKEGEDSPQTARNLILNLHKAWLINAGVDVKKLDGKIAEISPLISYGGENLNKKAIKEILDLSVILQL